MPHIRILAAAAAAALALAFAANPASARSCDDGNQACVSVAQQANPMKLDNFMKTWKPAGKSKRVKKSKLAPATAVKQQAPGPAVAETAVPDEPVSTVAEAPEKATETDGVAVTSFNEVNEIDAAADHVQVVAFNDVNEIDLAAPPPLVPVPETTGQQMASPEQTPADNSWIGKLLLAFAGTIAVAGTARLLIA